MTSPQESGERSAKRRAPMSCDRCKARKTKCVNPVPGPCQFCASIGAPCHLDPSRRRQRPYYHVSEEEFRYMTKALEHFLPGTELNLHSLKEVVRSIGSGVPAASISSNAGGEHHGPGSTSNMSDASPTPLATKSSGSQEPPLQPEPEPQAASSVTIEEIDELHGELGWLRVDSKGTYRHVGADSGYGFNAAVRSLKQRRMSECSRSDLVTPFTAAPPLPPETPESSSGLGLTAAGGLQQVYLPRRDLCNRSVARFFNEIHCIYWFFSAERFYMHLDRIYSGDSSATTPSMLCSLYSILALTCESEAAAQDGMPMESYSSASTSTASKYLSLAKALVPTLYDDADVDAIRALSLLGLALQSSMFSNTAYIYLGSAARIAFTLGLHMQRTIESQSCLQKQIDSRVFSTLFLLDLDVALCYGNPSAINEEYATGRLQDLSEQHLSPGTNMPLEYLSVSCKLAQLKRRISKLLYSKSKSRPTRHIPITTISDSITALRAWHGSIPPHLREAAQAASFHQRSVAILQLRYWSATIFATRPFLLYSVLHASELADSPKRSWFEDFSAVCIDAACRSLAVLVYMREMGLLSSLITLDTSCILEDMQVFLLASASGNALHTEEVRTCLSILQGMEQIFWTRHALTEVMAQLEENGMLNGDNGFSPREQTPGHGHFFLDMSGQHELMPGMNLESYLPDLQDTFFGMQERATSLMPSGGPFQEDMVGGEDMRM